MLLERGRAFAWPTLAAKPNRTETEDREQPLLTTLAANRLDRTARRPETSKTEPTEPIPTLMMMIMMDFYGFRWTSYEQHMDFIWFSC